jgi:hypothetical protein
VKLPLVFAFQNTKRNVHDKTGCLFSALALSASHYYSLLQKKALKKTKIPRKKSPIGTKIQKNIERAPGDCLVASQGALASAIPHVHFSPISLDW